MKCCIAALYLPMFYKLGNITSKFMCSMFDIGYSSPLRGGFLSPPALRVEAQSRFKRAVVTFYFKLIFY